MRKVGSILVALASAFLAASAVTANAATADSGEVVVFETEFNPLTTYTDPQGCNKLPPAAHVLTNRTGKTIHVHSDPYCLTPGLAVPPGHGTHTPPGSGSFSA